MEANNRFASWFDQDLEKDKCVAASNEHGKSKISRHQPGGTAIAARGAMTQDWEDFAHMFVGQIPNMSAE